jgi:hypothetical protein
MTTLTYLLALLALLPVILAAPRSVPFKRGICRIPGHGKHKEHGQDYGKHKEHGQDYSEGRQQGINFCLMPCYDKHKEYDQDYSEGR